MRRLFFLFLLPISLWATEVSPWVGNYLEVETRFNAVYQKFQHVSSGNGNFAYPSNDLFTQFSFQLSPDPDWSAELELLFADTRHRNYGFDSGKLTARYFFLSDIIGDPVSLSTGLSLILPIHSALCDIGSFHHGYAELEGHVAIGLETPYSTAWLQRQYSVFAFGLATQGSPWLRVQYVFEHALCNNFSAKFFIDSLFGLGRRSIHKNHFKGYGTIAHRSINTGLSVSYATDFWGTFSFDYAYRIYAKNFPRNVNLFQLSYSFTFNL